MVDEHLVGEIAVGDHDNGEGEELDRHNGSRMSTKGFQKELEAVQSARKRQEMGQNIENRRRRW